MALSERTRAELRLFLPESASVANPVDMLAFAPPDHYRRALAALIRDEHVDSILTIFIPPLVTNPEAVAAAIAAEAAAQPASRSQAFSCGPKELRRDSPEFPALRFRSCRDCALPRDRLRRVAAETSRGHSRKDFHPTKLERSLTRCCSVGADG